MSISFETGIYFNGYEFFTYDEMAQFLTENYISVINLVKDNTLFSLIKEGSVSLYEELYEATKDFEYCENVITYIIYRLSSKPIFVTKNHKFESTYDMALAMKRSYPDLNNDVLILLKERLLSKIYWDEYIFTNDPRHKRNHDFLITVEENNKYLYSYYYFLILHLPKEENMKFIVNNIKFSNIDELTSYLYTNQKFIHQLIKEIKTNYLVLGILASKSSMNGVSRALESDNYLDFLFLINSVNQDDGQSYDFSAILNNKMSVWLFRNYQNYSYKTTDARKLLKEYTLLIKKEDMSFYELFNQVKILDELYERFSTLYKSDRIIETVSDIVSNSDDYHLGYLYNDQVVCSRYLADYDLIKTDIYTPEYIIAQEKSLVINRLNKEAAKLEKYNDMLFPYYNTYDKERYNSLSSKFCIIASLLICLVCGFLFIYLEKIFYISIHEQFFVRILGAVGILICSFILIITTIEQNKLSHINDNLKKFNRFNKRINKMKIKVTNLTYYKEAVVTTEESFEEPVINNSIVKKRVKIKFLNRHQKFYNKALMLSKKQCVIKQYNLDILTKIGIAVAFLPALVFANHIVFNNINMALEYPLVSEFAVFYLIFSFINIVLLTNKKAYRNSFLFFIVSIIITIIINIL